MLTLGLLATTENVFFHVMSFYCHHISCIRLNCSKGYAEKKLKEMKEAFNVTHNRFDVTTMEYFLESGEINRLIGALDFYSTSRTRQLVAEGVMKMVFEFDYYGGDAVREKLMAVPGLLVILARYCGDEKVLSNSQQLVANISNLAIALSRKNPARLAVLVEAGWTDLLVKALHARQDDELTVHRVIWAISRLLSYSPAVCSAAFKAAGAEAALQEAKDRHSTVSHLSVLCTEALILLRE